MQNPEPALPPRQRILETARALVLEKGYRNATMRQICEGSGMSSGAIYHYFSGKDEIVAEALGEAFSGAGSVPNDSQQRADSQPQADALQQSMQDLLGGLDQDQARKLGSILLELIGQTVQNDGVQQQIATSWEPLRERLGDLVGQLQRSGLVDRHVAPAAAARVLHGLQLGLLVQVCVEGADHVPGYLDLVQRLLGQGFSSGSTGDSAPAGLPGSSDRNGFANAADGVRSSTGAMG